MIPGMSASLQMSSSAEARSGVKGDQRQDTSQSSGGNRGFVNNFAGGGSNIAPAEIGGPAWQPNTWVVLGIAAAVISGLVIWARRH